MFVGTVLNKSILIPIDPSGSDATNSFITHQQETTVGFQTISQLDTRHRGIINIAVHSHYKLIMSFTLQSIIAQVQQTDIILLIFINRYSVTDIPQRPKSIDPVFLSQAVGFLIWDYIPLWAFLVLKLCVLWNSVISYQYNTY